MGYYQIMVTASKALGLIFLFIATNYLNSFNTKPGLIIRKQNTALNFSSQLYQVASMGNRRLMSSLIWVQTLLESDTDHYKQKDLNSWMFLRFQHISELEPKFLQGYLYGGQYLSIIKDDDLGAEIIYDKGVKQYPEHYDLNFNAAFHYYFELGNSKKALNSFEKIQYNPQAPSYLPSLVAKVSRAQGTNLVDTFHLVKESYDRLANDAPMKQYFYDNMYAIKAEIDLECLNNKTQTESVKPCSYNDLDGVSYKKSNDGSFSAIKPWKPFKIRKK